MICSCFWLKTPGWRDFSVAPRHFCPSRKLCGTSRSNQGMSHKKLGISLNLGGTSRKSSGTSRKVCGTSKNGKCSRFLAGGMRRLADGTRRKAGGRSQSRSCLRPYLGLACSLEIIACRAVIPASARAAAVCPRRFSRLGLAPALSSISTMLVDACSAAHISAV